MQSQALARQTQVAAHAPRDRDRLLLFVTRRQTRRPFSIAVIKQGQSIAPHKPLLTASTTRRTPLKDSVIQLGMDVRSARNAGRRPGLQFRCLLPSRKLCSRSTTCASAAAARLPILFLVVPNKWGSTRPFSKEWRLSRGRVSKCFGRLPLVTCPLLNNRLFQFLSGRPRLRWLSTSHSPWMVPRI